MGVAHLLKIDGLFHGKSYKRLLMVYFIRPTIDDSLGLISWFIPNLTDSDAD